ncbi:winged helix-turn-helix domain-containing protein [Kitasatospora sp. NPDC056184]|uniref:helix-turn-helix domain-containing protein n=1 Tax=Kitasatospora sp. NPDC056184 TaxID=3345738 RepID=UPI0035DD8CBA
MPSAPLPACAPEAQSPRTETGGPGLHVPDPAQWISTTTGRIAPDTYTWMQAVHWVCDTQAHAPARSHGPRFGRTTIRIAQMLAQLTPCRPGVDYLVRMLKLSERTVQYHLSILRECGLLSYARKGSRVRQVGRRASEFVRTIPAKFDEEIGLRTTESESFIRKVVGVGTDEGRRALAQLGKKAARTVRRTKRRTIRKAGSRSSSASSRCTPMGVGAVTSSPATPTNNPSENDFGNGNDQQTHRGGKACRRLNRVGRRHQLGLELVQQVTWLSGSPVPRVAWAVRHLADAGWTAHQVIAVLAQRTPATRIHRPVGFLTARLVGAELLYDTEAKREAIVAWWRDSPQATRDRHTEWAGTWQAPRSTAVRTLVQGAWARAREIGRQPLVALDGQPTGEEHREARTTAWRQYLSGRPSLVTSALAIAGRERAEQIYGRDLVERVLRLRATTSHLRTGTAR